MQREVLVVSVHISGVGIRESLVESNGSLDGFVL